MRRVCGTYGRRSATRKPEGKRPLERPGHIWEDNIKTNLK
jgi:hypothetical protein